MPADTKTTTSFIETQFPVSKISKESYKERKANHSQTLTGLGKWWGRKPLVMIRAALIGLLMPSSDDLEKDQEIFLKIMTMDEGGMWKRMRETDGNIRYKDAFELLTEEEQERFFNLDDVEGGKAVHHCIDADGREEKKAMKQEIQRLAFGRLSYDEKLDYVDRPEQIDGPSEEAWSKINEHLDTDASSLDELIQELGERRFGHVPRVGDAFCGGGSVPFEAARLGCEAYGADLSPVAALLTWASLNIVGGGEEIAERVREAQNEVYAAVDEQITQWGIEHNEKGWRADAYLYCQETECPECGTDVPLAPSWVIGKRTNTIARLELDEVADRFDIRIEEEVSKADIEAADDAGTVQNDRLQCPACGRATPTEGNPWRSAWGERDDKQSSEMDERRRKSAPRRHVSRAPLLCAMGGDVYQRERRNKEP
jgi:adenine-specific DNA methylase